LFDGEYERDGLLSCEGEYEREGLECVGDDERDGLLFDGGE
jgi:hypothetical protein